MVIIPALHEALRETKTVHFVQVSDEIGNIIIFKVIIMRILTIKGISILLKVKEKTLYQWDELGQIPCIKLNGCLRFDYHDIVRWKKECAKEPHSGYNPLTQARGPRKGGDE
jgi:hypothetical protein